MAKQSPTSRALQDLRTQGWQPATVERWNPGARRRVDLFGGIDIIAVHPLFVGVLGIQVTTKAHMADRFTKLTTPPVVEKMRRWLDAQNALEIWGYAKAGPRGGRKTWQLTRRVVSLRDLEATHGNHTVQP